MLARLDLKIWEGIHFQDHEVVGGLTLLWAVELVTGPAHTQGEKVTQQHEYQEVSITGNQGADCGRWLLRWPH